MSDGGVCRTALATPGLLNRDSSDRSDSSDISESSNNGASIDSL